MFFQCFKRKLYYSKYHTIMLPYDFLWFLRLTNLLFGMSAVAALHGVFFTVSSLRDNSLTFSSPPSDLQSQNASKSEDQSELVSRLKSLELDNKNLHKVVDDLRAVLSKLESRMAVLEKSQAPASKTVTVTKAAPVQKPKVEEHNDADDDDIDLFGSDEEDEEAERIKAERVKEYAQRKAKKPALIAKSSILLDVKPWDDETDMSKLEECVRSIQMDGLLWGASKLVPVGYGIKKLQISCVVEDDKVGTDILEEEITTFEDYVSAG
uniref:Eukaryotic translation elongation factor 1 delta a (guanine nucleotide exchange protein) n=1 Tax=Cyprinus carpio carpio TaxID=630221 RepID=A0A9J8AEA9_CYPCA